MKKFDVAIIGGGVVGSAIAFELSRYNLDIVIFEMGSDVASGASKANSGVIHSGINSPNNSLKARFCVEGNKMFQILANELNFPLRWVGKFVIAKEQEEIKELEKLKKIGEKNEVPNLKILEKSEIKKRVPNIHCKAALWVPTAGITLPYQFNIALAENAAINDVKFFLETEVVGLKIEKNCFFIDTNKGNYKADIIVNSTGINCEKIVMMLERPDFKVYPCRGEYLVLDKKHSSLINSMIYQIPNHDMGVLGIHITPTIEGNILLGPSAEFIDNSFNKRNTKDKMNLLFKEAAEIIPSLPKDSVINAYSGIRCKISPPELGGWADYRIEESKETPGLINLIGIESPGLTAAPAIAKEISRIISKKIELIKKSNFKLKKLPKKRFSEMTVEEQSNLIKKDSRWGRIICRCENITEAEVINALSNPLGAKTISSVKYRCRAGMGRCQGGFCTQHIVRIMEEEFGMNVNDINLKSPNSHLFYSRIRGKI